MNTKWAWKNAFSATHHNEEDAKMENQILPFGAQFMEAPEFQQIEMPTYNPESQMSVGENFAPCEITDTYCWVGPIRQVCDSDSDCYWP